MIAQNELRLLCAGKVLIQGNCLLRNKYNKFEANSIRNNKNGLIDEDGWIAIDLGPLSSHGWTVYEPIPL